MSMTQAVQQAQTERRAQRAYRSQQMQVAAESYKQTNPKPDGGDEAALKKWSGGLALAMAQAIQPV